MFPFHCIWPVCTRLLPGSVFGDFSSHFHTQNRQSKEKTVCSVGHCTLKMVYNCLKFFKLYPHEQGEHVYHNMHVEVPIWFCPSTTWFPGIKLWSLGLVSGTFLYLYLLSL